MRRWSDLALAGLLLAGCGGGEAPDAITATGTLEVVEVDVSPLVPARVVRVVRDEGDVVQQGDTLATLTQATLGSDIAGRRARLAAAEATLRDLQAGARPAERARAAAELRVAEAEATRTAAELRRVTPLAEAGTVSRQQLDAARAAASGAASRRDAARDALRLVQEGTRPERVQAARAEVAAARAALGGAEATAADLVLLAPVPGVIASRNAEPGEVLGAGMGALTLAQVTRPYVRVYVGPEELPFVRVGAAVTGTLDGMPERAFSGRVVAVSTKAEFTPRVALTEDERRDLLFGVKVDFADSTGMLKAGLPITVRIPRGSGTATASPAPPASPAAR